MSVRGRRGQKDGRCSFNGRHDAEISLKIAFGNGIMSLFVDLNQ